MASDDESNETYNVYRVPPRSKWTDTTEIVEKVELSGPFLLGL
jgi:hypothetical protein